MKGTSAFGILYLPIPMIDVFAKAGQHASTALPADLRQMAFPKTSAKLEFRPVRPPFQRGRTNTTFAAGARVQFKIDVRGVRAEYERLNVAGETPHLVSRGLTWLHSAARACQLLTFPAQINSLNRLDGGRFPADSLRAHFLGGRLVENMSRSSFQLPPS